MLHVASSTRLKVLLGLAPAVVAQRVHREERVERAGALQKVGRLGQAVLCLQGNAERKVRRCMRAIGGCGGAQKREGRGHVACGKQLLADEKRSL